MNKDTIRLQYFTIRSIAEGETKRPDSILVQQPEIRGFPKIIVLVYGKRRYYCEQMNRRVPLLSNHLSGQLRGSAI